MESLFRQFAKQLGGFSSHIEQTESDGFWGHYIHTDRMEVIVFEDDKKHSIGYKRNALKDRAAGKYLAYIDSDDRIGDNYFKHAFTGIAQGVDACGLTGIITEDGQNPKKFVHSMRYDKYEEKDGVYLRYNNHLNVIQSDIAKQFKFPEINHGEDTDWATQIKKSGLIKTEYWDENEVIYHYQYRSKK
jgi:glycosyltransferase involved in cell wall biosynthesis